MAESVNYRMQVLPLFERYLYRSLLAAEDGHCSQLEIARPRIGVTRVGSV